MSHTSLANADRNRAKEIASGVYAQTLWESPRGIVLYLWFSPGAVLDDPAHPNTDEEVEVLCGRVHISNGADETLYSTGYRVMIGAGNAHQYHNSGKVVCELRVRGYGDPTFGAGVADVA